MLKYTENELLDVKDHYSLSNSNSETRKLEETNHLKTKEIHSYLEPIVGYSKRYINIRKNESILKRIISKSGIDLYDAYYGKSNKLGINTILSKYPELSKEASEIVLGSDDRIRIKDTEGNPWRWICSLLILANDDSMFLGTGWIVSNRTIITAGHCVYLHEHGGWPKGILVIPGYNSGKRPYGSFISRKFYSVKAWIYDALATHDYGAIVLNSNDDFNTEKYGCFNYTQLTNSDLQELYVNLAGYPHDKDHGSTLWYHARQISSISKNIISYDIDTAGGQSGAPVWIYNDNQREVIGIHTNGEIYGNSATRINNQVFDNIKEWSEI